MPIGTNTIAVAGYSPCVAATGRAEWKPGGATIDWSTVTPVSSDTTLTDGSVVLSGGSYLRYGTVMALITASGKYGPYASGASDGRQTLAPGKCFVINETVIKGASLNDTQINGIIGGDVYMGRITDIGANPSQSALLAVLPRMTPVLD